MSGFVRSPLVALAAIALRSALAFADAPTTVPGNGTPTDDLGNAKADTGSLQFRPTTDIVIRSVPDRTPKNIAILCAVTAVGLGIGGIGLYYHLDSRTASNEVSTGTFTHEAWTPALQAESDLANRDATRATIAYSVGGAFVIGAVVATILTAPAEQTTIMHPKVGVAPARGGASVAAAWSF